MSEREHILQWVVIYEDEQGKAQIKHQYDEKGNKENFQFVNNLGNKSKILIAIPKDQRIDSDDPVGNPFLAVDLKRGFFNINGVEWDFTPQKIIEKQKEFEIQKYKAIQEARAEEEQKAYDLAVEKTKDMEDRELATRIAKEAKNLSDDEYVKIDTKTLLELELDPISFRPIFYATTEQEFNSDMTPKSEPRFRYYKIGWQCTIDGENYQRIVFIDLDTNRYMLREKR